MNPVNCKSGPHPSLHSQNGEVREVQFVIERHCPWDRPLDEELREALAAHLPLATWVFWPGQESRSRRCKTDAPVYRLSPRGVAVVNESVPEGFEIYPAAFYVCEHMGRLIE